MMKTRSSLKTVVVLFISTVMISSTIGCQTIPKEGNAEKVEKKMLTVTANQKTIPVGEEIFVPNVSFNAATGEISYALDQPALVRIRIGLQNNGPLLVNFVDWEYRDKGGHKEFWQGRVPGSFHRYLGRKDLMITFLALAASKDLNSNRILPVKRKAPQLSILFPDSQEKDDAGHPIVSGAVSVRIVLEDEDASWLTNTGHETILYIDHQFLIEEERGVNPFTYFLETKNFHDGLHTVTATVSSFTGEAGSVSATVMVDNQESR